jgi:hypothetical protein
MINGIIPDGAFIFIPFYRHYKIKQCTTKTESIPGLMLSDVCEISEQQGILGQQ